MEQNVTSSYEKQRLVSNEINLIFAELNVLDQNFIHYKNNHKKDIQNSNTVMRRSLPTSINLLDK